MCNTQQSHKKKPCMFQWDDTEDDTVVGVSIFIVFFRMTHSPSDVTPALAVSNRRDYR